MKKQSQNLTSEASVVHQVMDILDYVQNQRIFLIGKPMLSQFNYLICGYTEGNYGELLKKKIGKEKND